MNASEKAAVLRQVADEIDPPIPARFRKPFSPQSLCNARPDPTAAITLSPYVLPPSVKGWAPVIAGGSLGITAYLARPADPPMTVTCGGRGPVKIPHWPADTMPASGSDGHADVIDVVGNTIHSFWQLHQATDGKWSASYYGTTALDGSGWGDGARAAGVSAIAMVIREHEFGAATIDHALAISLPYEALARNPAWVPPASRADTDAATTNSGQVPEGALLMLPADFPIASIVDPQLRTICVTLMTYGGRVVDRNVGTPFAIFMEADGHLWDDHGQFDLVRRSLRMVTSVARWLDADGQPFVPTDTSLTPPSAVPPAGAVLVTGEGQSFTSAGAWHWYGAKGSFVAIWLPPGTFVAGNQLAGDPLVGVFKAIFRA